MGEKTAASENRRNPGNPGLQGKPGERKERKRPEKPLLLVSACLCGQAVRYDGRSCPVPALCRLAEEGLAPRMCRRPADAPPPGGMPGEPGVPSKRRGLHRRAGGRRPSGPFPVPGAGADRCRAQGKQPFLRDPLDIRRLLYRQENSGDGGCRPPLAAGRRPGVQRAGMGRRGGRGRAGIHGFSERQRDRSGGINRQTDGTM